MLNFQKNKHCTGSVSLNSLKCQGLEHSTAEQYFPQRFTAYNTDYQYYSLEGASVFIDGL